MTGPHGEEVDLGATAIALTALAERDAEATHYEEAIAAFRDSLREHTRDRVPLFWAMTNDRLGIALAALGTLEWARAAREAATMHLEEAVAAYGNALLEFTPDRGPRDAARIQERRDLALRLLAEYPSQVS